MVVAGSGYGSPALLQAAANVAWALIASGKPARLSFTVAEPNTLGLGLMAASGPRPQGGDSVAAAFQAVKDGRADTVIILENDLFLRADAAAVEAFLDGAGHVIVLDHLRNPTSERAELALPAATFAEADGTLVNSEGRAQRFYQVFVPADEIQESWRWLRDIMVAAGRSAVRRLAEPG